MSTGEPDEPCRIELSGNSRAYVAVVRRAARVCLPEEMTIEFPGLGEVVLRSEVLAVDAAWIASVRQSCDETSIECAGGTALLLVERGLALHTVSSILGCEGVIAAGALSRVERGILQGVLAALCARMGLGPEVRLCATAGQVLLSDPIAVEFRVEMRGGSGRAWLCASVEFLTEVPIPEAASSWQASLPIRLELGRTRVLVSELAAAREGDAVLFEGIAAWPVAGPWPVRIRRGETVVPACLRRDGSIAIAGTEVDGKARGDAVRTRGRTARTSVGSAAMDGAGRAVTDAEVAAEVGRLEGATMTGLLRGTPLGRNWEDPILLRVDDAPWAEGEMVAIGGEFAVRIRRMLAG